MIDIEGWHLPLHDVARADPIARGAVRVHVPRLVPADIDAICDRLLDAQRHLETLTTADIIAAIDAAARMLRDPAEPERAAVLHSLRDVSGLSDAMAAHVLDRMAEDWLAPALQQLVGAELGDASALDGFTHRAGRRVRAVAPRLGFHVFSGNVPGVSVTSIVRSLLVRTAVLGKSAAAEPALAPAFARLLARVSPRVGACVAIAWWPGGDERLEQAALGRAGIVVHYGGADAIASLRARAHAHVTFVEHGPRISFAVIHAAALREPARLRQCARDTAAAVALFDQQGCVSPQLAYVIGSADDARALAEAVAAALDDVQRSLPRGALDAGEAAAIREARTRAEFGAIRGDSRDLWGPDSLDYSVILSDDVAFEGSCLNRTLVVKAAPDIDAVLDAARPFAHLLQTVGLAGFDDAHRDAIALLLARVGVTRIAAIADMPWPPPDWHHDGRGPLTELIRWVDLDA
jgi:hypothetical protein